MTDTDPTAAVWGLFVLLETTADQDKDLPDPEVDAFLEAAESEVGTDGLLSRTGRSSPPSFAST